MIKKFLVTLVTLAVTSVTFAQLPLRNTDGQFRFEDTTTGDQIVIDVTGNEWTIVGTTDIMVINTMTEAQRDALTPAAGMVVYNSTATELQAYDGSNWLNLGAGAGGGETNTASNLGGGLANFSTKVGVDLQFNTFGTSDFDLATNVLTIDRGLNPSWTVEHVFGAGLRVNDDVDIAFGTDSDIQVMYDELTDNRLEWSDGTNLLMALTDAGTTGDLLLTGDATINGGQFTMTSATTAEPVLLLENTNADATGMILDLFKNSASPLDDDELALIRFRGDDSGTNATTYAQIQGYSSDVTNPVEGGGINISMLFNGTMRNMLEMQGYQGSVNEGEFIVNQDGQDVDFRVEGGGFPNMIVGLGSSGFVGLNNAAPAVQLDVTGEIYSSLHLTIGGGAVAQELRLLEASGSGTEYTSFAAVPMAANVAYTLPPDDGDAGEQLQTDGAGVLTWEAAGGAGATAWDDIGDPDATATINFAGFDQDIQSAEDGGDILTITNTDVDRATESIMLALQDNDADDAQAVYLRMIQDADGTPATDYDFAQDGATFNETLTMAADINIAANNIVTAAATIASTELDRLDGLAGIIATDVTAVTNLDGTALTITAGALGVTADGITATQIDETDNYTWTGTHDFSGALMTLDQGAAPAPTVEGRIEWETDDDHIIVGDGVAQVEFVPAEDVSGDITMDDAGAVTIAAAAVENSMHANMAQNTIKMRVAAGAGDPEDIDISTGLGLVTAVSGDFVIIEDATDGNIRRADAGDFLGGGVTWDAIGDAAGNGSVGFGDTEQILVSSQTTGDVTTLTLDINQVDDAAATDDLVAFSIDATSESGDAGDTFRLMRLLYEEGVANTILDAAILIDNQETTASTMTDAIIITSTGVDGGVVDAIDVSAGNITNAINIGANNIITGAATIASTELDRLDGIDAALVDLDDTPTWTGNHRWDADLAVGTAPGTAAFLLVNDENETTFLAQSAAGATTPIGVFENNAGTDALAINSDLTVDILGGDLDIGGNNLVYTTGTLSTTDLEILDDGTIAYAEMTFADNIVEGDIAADAITTAELDDGADTPADEQLLSYETTGAEIAYQDIVDFLTGGTNLSITGTTNATLNVDDAFVINSGSDVMTGTLTADGLTLGANENITLGAQTLDHDGTTFVFNDDVTVSAEAYAAGWNASNEVPTKNDVYDKLEDQFIVERYLAGAFNADAGDLTAAAALATIENTTNDVSWEGLAFDAAADEYATIAIPMPHNWDGTTAPEFQVVAVAEAVGAGGTQEVVWSIAAAYVRPGTDVYDGAYGTAASVTDTYGTADQPERSATFSPTPAGTAAADCWLFVRIFRDADNAADDHATDIVFTALYMEYAADSWPVASQF